MAEEPIVELYASDTEPGDVVIYGLPNTAYALETRNDPTGQTGWTFVRNITLTRAFHRLEGAAPAGPRPPFRARKL